ncbi:MAG: metallophosphoesterase [Deltaproteobacteria bacterium]|jgi:predicted MPP superfamily phosphohydrolase|nr:metallophosphoesterase [Deltaproteobacteria bacterium]
MMRSPALALVMLLIQVLTVRFLLRRLRRPLPSLLVAALYLTFNLAAVVVFFRLHVQKAPPPADRLWFCWVWRPALAWEHVHLAWAAPAALLTVLDFLLRPLRRSRRAGLPRLFKAGRPASAFWNLRTILLAGMLAVSAYGLHVQNQPPIIHRSFLSLPNLPPALEGFSIAVLSDLHYGRGLNEATLAEAMSLAASAKPDLIVLAGDLIDDRAELAWDWRQPLASLRSVPYGVCAVLGNHDLLLDDPAREEAILTKLGVEVLSGRRLNLPGLPLSLIGFADTGEPGMKSRRPPGERFDFRRLAGPPRQPGHLVVFVNHRPEGFAEAAAAGASLYLAGHLHGGQAQVPWFPNLNLARLVYGLDLVHGPYQEGPLTIYVTKGLASSTVPFRLWAWPEISLLTIKSPTPRN